MVGRAGGSGHPRVAVLVAGTFVLPAPSYVCDLGVQDFRPAGERDRPGVQADARATAAAYTPFTRQLPIPPVKRGRVDETGVRHMTIRMREADVPILPGRPTRMWTYDGTFPGPTIRVPSGRPVRVKFVNDLPAAAGGMTTHLHGGHNRSSEDGQPDSQLIPPGGERTYDYELVEDGRPERASFKWYHDHRMDMTARNVWNGLAGMFILDDEFERRLPLPKGEFDVPLLLTDRNFTADNQLTQPYPETDPIVKLIPEIPEIGDHDLVNGVPKPVFDVADRKYRLRIANLSTFRWYKLHLSNDRDMVQIGTESGLIPRPVPRKEILLGPAERIEVVVDFSGMLGQTVVLDSLDHPAPPPDGTRPPAGPLMHFRVKRHVKKDPSRVPESLRPLPDWVKQASMTPDRSWNFSERPDPEHGRFAHTINDATFDPQRVDARVNLDSVETWELKNSGPVPILHWVHIHDVSWYVLSRNGSPPEPGEAALKETFRLEPNESVLVAAKFPDNTGPYMIHCHMLEHEDTGMMTQFEVEGPADTEAPSLADLSLSRRAFRVDPRGRPGVRPVRRARQAKGATLRFGLDDGAMVAFSLERRVGRRRHVPIASFSHYGAPARNLLRLSGRVRSRRGVRRLGPGRYRLTATATDKAGNQSQPRRVGFRVVER